MDPSEGPQRDSASPKSASGQTEPHFSWPPPGLESVQGKLWSVIAVLAVGDVALVAPLLWSVTTNYEFWRLGPFGNNWWIPLAMSGVGIVVVLDGWGRLLRLLRAGSRAGKQGHRWMVFLQTVSDQRRDTGFLIQGARYYSRLSPIERRTLLLVRLAGSWSYLVAVLWAPLGFVLATLAGARGWIESSSVVPMVLVPTVAFFILGAGARLLANLLVRSSRSDGGIRAEVEEDVRLQVAEWNERAAGKWSEVGFHTLAHMGSKGFDWMTAGVIGLAMLVLVPVVTITLTGALGAVITSIAVPNFSRTQARFAVSELLRPYAAASDDTVSPQEAGLALQSLTWVSVEFDGAGIERAPQRRYPGRWFPADHDSVMDGGSLSRRNWAIGLFGRIGSLGATEKSYLETVASHPAHQEFEILAKGPETDIVGARFKLPLPDTLSRFALPIPKLAGLSEGAWAHVAQAAWEFSRGRSREAEQKVREVIATGFSLIDEGPTLFDGLIGVRIVKVGGDALEQLYRAMGRSADAEALSRVLTGINEIPKRAVLAKRAGPDLEHELRTIQYAITDESAARGIRWEYLTLFATLAPCVNLQRVVFGPGESYERWLEAAEQSLVRRPSDAAMFAFLKTGLFGSRERASGPVWMRALVRLTFGSGRGGSCAVRITQLSI